MKNLPTLQDLFNNSVFKIPDYQRGYSWENQHREDLLEDLELIQNKGHYTGTVVLKENGTVKGLGKTYNHFDIVDGQQRFTSIIILLDCIVKQLREINNEESNEIADGINSIYIKEKGLGGNTIYKMELDDENDDYFKEAIIEDDLGINRTIKSHERLYDAKNQFNEYLNNKKNTENNYFEYLNSLIDKLTQSLIFTLYKVEDDAEVGVIFEVMNDRGKPLSELEKVKNFLIYLTGKISEDEDSSEILIKNINNYWKEILENLAIADMSRNDDEDRFLRMNYIINFYSDLRAKKVNGKRISKTSQLANIYKQLKSNFKDLERNKEYEKCYDLIWSYVLSLKNTSYRLRDITQPESTHAFQVISDDKLRNRIKNLCLKINRLDIRSNILVLLVSMYEKYLDKPEELLDLMDLSEIYVFRAYYIAGYRSYSGQDRIYNLACDIFNDKVKFFDAMEEIINLTNYYSPEEKIADYLSNPANYYEWNGIKYFLYEYEQYKCQKEIDKEPKLTWEHLRQEDKKNSIEHILPQTIRGVDYWTERFDNILHEENSNRLGNLTLTTPPENSKLSNHSFDDKKIVYKDSVWRLNKELEDYPEWTQKYIEKREQKLINYAKFRWGFIEMDDNQMKLF